MKYVGALDIGSTTVRCHIYDEEGRIVGSGKDTITLLHPRPRWVEMDPEEVWLKVKSVVSNAIKDAQLTADRITCLGISCQRGSTITWRKSSGKPLHNFICWQDMRADELMQATNSSFLMKVKSINAEGTNPQQCVRFVGSIGYALTGSTRMLAFSTLKVFQGQPSLLLSWALQNIDLLKEAVTARDAAFGTMSSWILYKLSKERVHIADASTLCTTGVFDPFTMKWSSAMLRTYGIPEDMLPTLVDAIGPLCVTDVFGASIPITACVSDVSASMFGSKCFGKGDLNIILGTGTFVNVNTGDEVFISSSGTYPTVGWQIGSSITYTMEGLCHNTAPVIKSAINMGLTDSPEKSAEVASSVPDTDGVSYIPAFSGLPVPVNDLKAAVGMIGIKVSTDSRHMLRAMLESIAFRVKQITNIIQADTGLTFLKTRISGGVSQNELILKTISSLTGLSIARPANVETSALGAAYLSGLGAGVWKNIDNLPSNQAPDAVFPPCGEESAVVARFTDWEGALPRFQNWYSST